MSQTLPLDPMYTRFRERHPEVTLVLLPGGANALDAEHTPAMPQDPEAAEHELAQTHDEVGLLLTDVCAAIDAEARIEVHWRSGSRYGSVRAVASTHAPLDLTPEDVFRQLGGLGWHVRFTSRGPVPCLDARDGDHALRAVIHEGRALLTLTGPDVAVGPRRSGELVNADGVGRE